MDANDAASYVQELTGEDANIIFGAMYDDSVADYARITVIATGLDDSVSKTGFMGKGTSSFGAKKNTQQTGNAARQMPNGMNMPNFHIPNSGSGAFTPKQPTSTVQKKDIQIPDFLKNR